MLIVHKWIILMFGKGFAYIKIIIGEVVKKSPTMDRVR